VAAVSAVSKKDLDQANHLCTGPASMLKIQFRNVEDMLSVRRVILPRVQKNKEQQEAIEAYAHGQEDAIASTTDVLDTLTDIWEYDVAYVTRVTIDTGFRVGLWYDIKAQPGSKGVEMVERKELEQRPLMKTMAFDIETTKLPLKFPNAEVDQIMMISYMLDNQGFLIVNREVAATTRTHNQNTNTWANATNTDLSNANTGGGDRNAM
jgi:DNA polymerase epsilon subunit 1